MPRPWPATIVVAAFLFVACGGEHTPVLPTDPGNGTPGGVTVTVTSDRSSIEATATAPALLTIAAHQANGTNVADGTTVTINTNLGGFGVGADGKPVQLVSRQLAGGVATVEFFAGDTVGTANILAQAGTSVGRLNLPVVQPTPKPSADFTFEVSGLSVLFTDTSTGAPASRRWQFGDGTESTDARPKHDYAASGTYTVTLTVANSADQSSKSKFVAVTQGPAPVASFTAQVSGRSVILTDTSTGDPVKWTWEFGDGDVDSGTHRSVTHTYASPGAFQVKLTIENAFGVQAFAAKFVTLDPAPQAHFTAAADGYHVLFTDTSTGTPTVWSWDFGDCTISPSTCKDARQNTDHTYGAAGTYDVTLTVSNSVGTTSYNQLVTVPSGAPPVADFKVETSGLTAIFTDASTGNPTKWQWNFGDCAVSPDSCTSTAQSPTHVYAQAGKYSVSLMATNGVGASSKTTFVTVPATTAPVAAFEFQTDGLFVHFVDRSTGSPTSYLWNFGDGTTPSERTQANPVHHYAKAGTYTVTLQVSNLAGQSSASNVVTTPPAAGFNWHAEGLTVNFFDQSGNATAWEWNFGDCATAADCVSTLPNPTHTYAAAGTYPVTLKATNAAGSTTEDHSVTVTVPPPATSSR